MLKIAWHPNYILALPEKHRFPMQKYALLPEKLVSEGIVEQHSFFSPGMLDEASILAVHKSQWWRKLKDLSLDKSEIRRTGFPLSRALIDREITIAQGSIDACKFALEYGAAMNIAGGTHHAGPDFGEGFCLLNDIAIAAQYLLDHKLVSQILVVDLDVHQGNGTALIFRNDPRVFTFSMHGAKNFPFKKAKSDLDIGLDDGTTDSVYLSLLEKNLGRIIDLTRAEFIFYQSGVDVLEADALGRLSLSMDGCRKRDSMVYKCAQAHSIPVCTVMGGGYAPDLDVIVSAHLNTYREAVKNT